VGTMVGENPIDICAGSQKTDDWVIQKPGVLPKLDIQLRKPKSTMGPRTVGERIELRHTFEIQEMASLPFAKGSFKSSVVYRIRASRKQPHTGTVTPCVRPEVGHLSSGSTIWYLLKSQHM
jgi:hypothetical protein